MRTNPQAVVPVDGLVVVGLDAVLDFAEKDTIDADAALDAAQIDVWLQQSALVNSGSAPAFYSRMKRYPQLPNDQLLKLVAVFQDSEVNSAGQRTRAADEALERICGSMFKLVLIICRELAATRFGGQAVAAMLPDLVGEALVAVTEATKRFSVTSGGNFSAYAARAVRDRVRSAIASEHYKVEVPTSWKRVARLAQMRGSDLAERLGREPTLVELREDLTLTCYAWARQKLTKEQQALTPAEQEAIMTARLRKQGILAALNSLADVLSANRPVLASDARVGSGDSETTLGDLAQGTLVGASATESMFDTAEHQDLADKLGKALAGLTDRERYILMCRYGFVENHEWTYPEIAKRFSVSPERIRQIEREALQKLAANDSQFGLGSFLG